MITWARGDSQPCTQSQDSVVRRRTPVKQGARPGGFSPAPRRDNFSVVSAKKRRDRPSSSAAVRPPAPVRPADRRRPDWVLIAILAVAFLARVGVLLTLHDHPLLQPRPGLDSAVYLDLAREVAGGDVLGGDRVFFLSPFYIYFAAAGLALSGGSVLAVQFVQVLLGTAAVWLVAQTAGLWFGVRGARIAAALAAGTGYFAFQESLLLQSAVDPFLTAVGLWALARAWVEPHWPRFLLAGTMLGLHVLNRPNMALWAAVAVLVTAFGEYQRREGVPGRAAGAGEEAKGGVRSARALLGLRDRAGIRAAALVAGLVISLAPVAVRNYAVAGDLALVSSHGGLNFFIGNNPRADGTYRPVEGITPSIEGQAQDMRRVAAQGTGRPQSDTEASRWFRDRAAAWIEAHPGAAVWLFAKKLAYVFNAADIPLNDSYAYYATDEVSPLRVLIAGPWLLLPLGLAGIWFGRPRRSSASDVQAEQSGNRERIWWRWVAFVPVYALGVALFFVTGRYRLPILLACCVTAAGCVLFLVDRWRAERWRELGVALGAVALLGAATHVDLGLDNGLGAWRAEMILEQIATGQDAEAEALLARTEPTYPNRSLLLYRVGRAWLARGDAGRALPVLERARSAAPGRKEIDLEIGKALLALGRAPEAVGRLEAARETPEREDEARVTLAQAKVMAGHPEEALGELAALRAPEALDPGLQIVAGRLALELGRADVAEPFLARAVKAAPENAEVREAYGLALATVGKRTEAVAALEEVCRLDPSNAGVRMNLAILYADAGRIADARRLAVEALRIRPDEPRAREFLASLPPGR